MKKPLIILILLVCLDRSAQAAVALDIIFDGPPGNRTLRNPDRLSHIDCARYGPLISACCKSVEAKAYILGLADTIDVLLPQAHAALSTSKGRGERGRQRHRVAADIAKILPPGSTPSTPTSTRSPSSESVSSDDGSVKRTPSRVRVALGAVVDTVVGAVRSVSPGRKLSSAVDGFQTPIQDKRLQQLRGGEPAPGAGGAGTGSAGGSPSRASSVSRFSFRTPPESPDSAASARPVARIQELEAALKAQTTVSTARIKELEAQIAGKPSKTHQHAMTQLVAAQSKVQELEAQMLKMLPHAKHEEIVADLQKRLAEEQKERLALTSRLSSTQKTNAELLGRVHALEGGGHGVISATAAHSASTSDLLGPSGKPAPLKKGGGWFGKKS